MIRIYLRTFVQVGMEAEIPKYQHVDIDSPTLEAALETGSHRWHVVSVQPLDPVPAIEPEVKP